LDNKTVVVISSNPAETHLLEPVVEELKKRQEIETIFLKLENYIPKVFSKIIMEKNPSIVVVPCDREEMLRVAIELFYNRIPMAHFHAGDISKEGSFDDIARHMITLMCDVHFCNGSKAKKRVETLLKTIGKCARHVYNVGTTAFDNVEIDYSIVPNEPFDLVLYNSPTRRLEDIDRDLEKIEKMLNKKTIWIYPNKDVGCERIIGWIERLKQKNSNITTYYRVPHPQFLGLIKKCDRFIGNSSSIILEAPYFKTKTIRVGLRNRGREIPEFRKGASKRISDIILRWLNEKEKMGKTKD